MREFFSHLEKMRGWNSLNNEAPLQNCYNRRHKLFIVWKLYTYFSSNFQELILFHISNRWNLQVVFGIIQLRLSGKFHSVIKGNVAQNRIIFLIDVLFIYFFLFSTVFRSLYTSVCSSSSCQRARVGLNFFPIEVTWHRNRKQTTFEFRSTFCPRSYGSTPWSSFYNGVYI